MKEKITQTAGRQQLGAFAPMFAHLNDDVLFGEVWNEEAIDTKTKCILNKTHYEMTMKWLNKIGLLHNISSNMDPEKTHLLEQLTLRAASEEEISISKAAELLDRPFWEVRQLCFGGV